MNRQKYTALIVILAIVIAVWGFFMSIEKKNIATTEEEMRALIEERVQEIDDRTAKFDKTLPPWKRMPGFAMTHQVWRMGSGDDVRTDFFEYYSSLDSDKRTLVREEYPEPEGWKGYYDLISGGAE